MFKRAKRSSLITGEFKKLSSLHSGNSPIQLSMRLSNKNHVVKNGAVTLRIMTLSIIVASIMVASIIVHSIMALVRIFSVVLKFTTLLWVSLYKVSLF
jgi:hypothetical protein